LRVSAVHNALSDKFDRTFAHKLNLVIATKMLSKCTLIGGLSGGAMGDMVIDRLSME